MSAATEPVGPPTMAPCGTALFTSPKGPVPPTPAMPVTMEPVVPPAMVLQGTALLHLHPLSYNHSSLLQ